MPGECFPAAIAMLLTALIFFGALKDVKPRPAVDRLSAARVSGAQVWRKPVGQRPAPRPRSNPVLEANLTHAFRSASVMVATKAARSPWREPKRSLKIRDGQSTQFQEIHVRRWLRFFVFHESRVTSHKSRPSNSRITPFLIDIWRLETSVIS